MEQKEIRIKKTELQNQIDEIMQKVHSTQDNKEIMDLLSKLQQLKIEYNQITEIEKTQYMEKIPEDFFEETTEKHM